jgi:hypothetical protein
MVLKYNLTFHEKQSDTHNPSNHTGKVVVFAHFAHLGVKGFFANLREFVTGQDRADRIISPHGVVADGAGKVYVADWGRPHTLLRF